MSAAMDFLVFPILVTVFLASSFTMQGVVTANNETLQDNPNLQAAFVLDFEKAEIVNLHNKLRSQVKPPANDMVKMVWDDKLEEIAQKWAKQCVPYNDKINRGKDYGVEISQNVGAGALYWGEAIKTWFSEKDKFMFGKSASNYPKPDDINGVQRYARMVYAKTSRVGCGFAVCSGVRYFVCNYAPSVSGIIDTPYTAYWERRCALCHNNCKLGVCDCGGKFCMNSATLMVQDCSCRCVNNTIFSGERCEKVTCPKTDSRGCWDRMTSCSGNYVMSNCPHMCGLCGDSKLAKKPPTYVSDIGCEFVGHQFSNETCSRLGDNGKDKPGCRKQVEWVTCLECRRTDRFQNDCPIACGICQGKEKRLIEE